MIEINSDSENTPRFDPAKWIGQNKVYRDLPTQVTAAKFTAAHTLPTVVIRQLPIPDIMVTEFLLVPLPNILENDAPFPKQPSSWFSPDPPNCEDTSVHSIKSIPPLALIRRLEEALPQAWLDGPYRSKSLEIVTLRAAQDKWTESLSRFPDTEKHFLNYVSWNSIRPGAPDVQLDSTRLLSDEWISSGIINEMMRDINTRISEDPVLSASTIV
ncbi:hypothetical protein DFH07DRAFT_939974 [Mycena maculata]|uniref:Uncharacterized protein n=1 Tax=Mycena maculata TaxID=230809 RepID=A0AAD7JD90_9AGAR|nr:hypothetical protein DFH07DRAFT_939974 [Mycena maculata]